MPDARRSLSRISSVVTTAVPSVTGVSVGTVGDSTTVRVSPPELQAAAQATIDAFDWSDAAQAAWELARTRYAALTGLLTRGDDIGIGVRAVTRAITTLINDRLEALGQPRVMEAEILALIDAMPAIGDPVPP